MSDLDDHAPDGYYPHWEDDKPVTPPTPQGSQDDTGHLADTEGVKALSSKADTLSANAKLGLPRDKMRKITVAFDVDGTLRCNCTDTCDDGNQRIYDLFLILDSFKNTDLYVWSGGGADYAWRFAQKFGLPVKQSRCIGKLGGFRPDIAIDDIQDTAIGAINLIVNEKRLTT